MKSKIFNHEEYKRYSGKYLVSSDGTVTNLVFSRKLKIHRNNRSAFVRLSGEGKNLSITISKLLLLVFKPKKYKKGYIVIHKDGNINNNSLSNLYWGTRYIQAHIAMKNPKNRNRVSKMGKKYGKIFWKTNLITDGRFLKNKRHSEKIIDEIKKMYDCGKSPTEISHILNISRSSIYNHIQIKQKK